jgi:hypothetical protein
MLTRAKAVEPACPAYGLVTAERTGGPPAKWDKPAAVVAAGGCEPCGGRPAETRYTVSSHVGRVWEELERRCGICAGREAQDVVENRRSAARSGAMTWHQWQLAYPTDRKTGTSRRRASSNASASHSRQCTGFSACCRRYGDDALASRFATVDHALPRLLSGNDLSTAAPRQPYVGRRIGPMRRGSCVAHGATSRRSNGVQPYPAGLRSAGSLCTHRAYAGSVDKVAPGRRGPCALIVRLPGSVHKVWGEVPRPTQVGPPTITTS